MPSKWIFFKQISIKKSKTFNTTPIRSSHIMFELTWQI
jgi:hypothetical protein